MRRRVMACALLLCYLPACTSWRVQDGINPERLIADQNPWSVRLVLADSSRIVLERPRTVLGDSLNGFQNGSATSVAVSDVRQVSIRKFAPDKTAALVVGISIVTYVVALVLIQDALDGYSVFPGGWAESAGTSHTHR